MRVVEGSSDFPSTVARESCLTIRHLISRARGEGSGYIPPGPVRILVCGYHADAQEVADDDPILDIAHTDQTFPALLVFHGKRMWAMDRSSNVWWSRWYLVEIATTVESALDMIDGGSWPQA